MSRALAVAVLLLAGCDRGPPPLDDCGGDLHGVWRVAETGVRWQAVLGREADWELYPLDPEGDGRTPPPPGVVSAPAVLDLDRAPPGADQLTGTLSRRYELNDQLCPIRTPARLHGCTGDRAILEVAPPQPPITFAPCTAPLAPTVTWTLIRD